MKDINKADFNEINAMIINRIKIELAKDLSPNELNSIARLALAFQKEVKDEIVDENRNKESIEAFKSIMSLLDGEKIYKQNDPESK